MGQTFVNTFAESHLVIYVILTSISRELVVGMLKYWSFNRIIWFIAGPIHYIPSLLLCTLLDLFLSGIIQSQEFYLARQETQVHGQQNAPNS